MPCDGCQYCVPNWNPDSNDIGCTRKDWETGGDCFEQGTFVPLSDAEMMTARMRIRAANNKNHRKLTDYMKIQEVK